MGLEDFERELLKKEKSSEYTSKKRSRDHDESERPRDRDSHRDRHHHHHRSRKDAGDDDDDRSKRRREHEKSGKRERVDRDDRSRRHKRRRSESRDRPTKSASDTVKVFDSDNEGEEDDWVEKETVIAPQTQAIPSSHDEQQPLQRDAWMKEPSALDIDYVQSRRPKEPQGQFVSAKHNRDFQPDAPKESNHVADLERDFDSDDEERPEEGPVGLSIEPAQHTVSYTFGDSGSSWRMTKLKAVYRQAKESGREVDEVALERYGSLRDFDDAREEEREMDRREVYGKEYVGLERPSGELYQDRKMEAGVAQPLTKTTEEVGSSDKPSATTTTLALDATALNKLKAEMLKARLRNAPNAAQSEEEYNIAASAQMAQRAQPDVVVLNRMDDRQLAGGREGEITRLTTKRGRERGLVEENENMSVDDMVRQEKRTRGVPGGEGRAFADRIAKDAKFTDDLDYMDDNAAKLGKRAVASDVNVRNTAIADFQKMQRILDTCPLCSHEDTGQPPVAPVISLATRTYMTLPTEPELVKGGAVIVPIQHRLNLLECDDDEWEEMRNFMKSLTRFYHAQDKSVIFYENAAFAHSRKGHAALNAVPLPHHLAENGPAFFKEAILASDEQWSQHRPIIDTMALAQRPGYGRQAFRKAIPKEMPYFHVFFTLDGGLGHVIEDERRWPKGDLFAREIIGGMLDRGPEIIKRQGRWQRNDPRVEAFNKKWKKHDWTTALIDAA